MYCLVSTFNKTFDELGLIYFIPSFLEGKIKQGKIVEIPVWEKIEIAVVLKVWELKQLNTLDISEDKIKSIIWIKNSNIFLNKNQLFLASFIAKHYFTPIHNSISLFFPKNLREKINKDKLDLQELIEKQEEIEYIFDFDKKLSKKQEKIFNIISSPPTPLLKGEGSRFLLHWVTGSWKTEIYIKLIKEQLEKGKQSLLLIPEIILTNQLESRLKKVFWENILTINSSITEANKTKAWISIYSWNAKIIIWTRSSLFYPYNNLWLIIIDEEHDNSYISDQAPRYNSIEIAEKITELSWNTLLIASWTPSINSMYKWVKGEYKLLELLEKFDNN